MGRLTLVTGCRCPDGGRRKAGLHRRVTEQAKEVRPMSSTHPILPIRPQLSTDHARPSRLRRFLERTGIVFGAIAMFLGVFVSFAGEDQSIGFFGVWSVHADEVSGWWTFALLAGGTLLLGMSLWSAALRRRSSPAP
jgi:hypothetical protein